MKFTLTPLGGGRADVARVVDAIVRYLQPQPQPPPPTRATAPGMEGPARYYADGGEEPGRWLGRTAHTMGLAGTVRREDFAAMLAGRDPHTGARLITARGSAGRRSTLGAGTHTRLAADGEPLYAVGDAAAALGLSHREVEQLLDDGAAHAVGHLAAACGPTRASRPPGRPPGAPPAGPPVGPPAELTPPRRPPVGPPVGGPAGRADGASLVPLVAEDGSRWVRAGELARYATERDPGVDPAAVRAGGDATDRLTIPDAARLAGVTPRYLRGLARYHDDHRDEIARTLAAGRHPRHAFLVADRDPTGRWLVTRERLAELLERRRPPAVRVAYDLTLTTEKSLGVLALLADPPTRDAVLGAIQAGNDWALGWLQDHAALARIDGQPIGVDGFAVASFRHLTSRALDPFPHHHNVIINTARLPDGTHRGLWSRPLFANARAASALATVEMRHQLTARLGVRWRAGRTGGWEIAGITDPVIGEFSRRRTEIDDALAELEAELGRGAHPREVEHIVLRTRPTKRHTPAGRLTASWRQRAAQHGLDTDTLTAIVGHEPHHQRIDVDALFRSLAGPDGICTGSSVFSRTDALAALANHPVPTRDTARQPLLGGAQQLLELTDQFLASPQVVALTDGHDPLYTTVEMLAVQDRIVARYVTGLHRGAHLVADRHVDTALAAHPHLTGEQRRLVTDWCQRGHRYHTAIGRAGAGKTTTIAACVDAWTAAGYRVVGAAVKGEATRTLAAATGIDCETVAWYLAHPDPQHLPLDAATILVVDEASTLSDRDLDTLMGIAATTGAGLRFIGDPAQHGAIAAGGMFRVLSDRYQQYTPELTVSHRLSDPHDRAAAQALRDGRIDEAFDQLTAAGHLHVVGDELTLYRHLLARWWDANRHGLDHPMVDQRNHTRHHLNRLAHQLRRANGELGDEQLAASGGRGFAVGDRITARAPNRQLHVPGDRHAYIRNGALGTITAIHPDPSDPARDTITVDFDQIGTITIPRSFFDHHPTPTSRADVGIDHAYALTSYAVQGATHPTSTSRVDPTTTRAETYVDITRGRHANHLYLTTTPTGPHDDDTLPRIPAEPADLAVAERLRRSTSELTAWELAHPTHQPPQRETAIGI